MGESDAALAALDAILRVNPEHLEARRLRAEVAAAAAVPGGEPAPADAAAAPAGATARENADAQPRNPGSQEAVR
jgi:hypothetical protein